jgi:DNA helicase-2/ATP-dependent DNA helicase PcrA
MAQYTAQVAVLEQLRDARERVEVDPASPYFAHMRLLEDGKTRDVCLGRATRIEAGIRIIDWRNAPISKLFYQFQQGEEYEEEVGERVIAGVITARRSVAIRGGTLERVEAPEGSFVRRVDGAWERAVQVRPRMLGGEGVAMQVYGSGEGGARRLGTDLQGHRRRADKHLPDIAGLIDAEQFKLITKPTSGFVVIRGTAGSGKTTVALHRIAWMAFQDPEIDGPRTLFVVFSRALRDYVSHVLPALGVGRVQVAAYGDWARTLCERHFPMLPREVRDDTPAVVVRLKLHPEMAAVLEHQVASVPGPATSEQAVDDWMSALTNLPLLRASLPTSGPGAFSDGELERAVAWLRDRHEELVQRMEGDRNVRAAVDEEDAPLLLRTWQLRVGPLRGKGRMPLQYRHIALDEVQDLTPLEVRVLLDCLDKHRSITLAGDTQQHVMADAGFTSWADFFQRLGVEGVAVDTLKVSYRSSAEIVRFAVNLLGDLREDEPPLATRSGPNPELFRFTDHGAAVAFLGEALRELLKAEPLASVAVLTGRRELTRLYFKGLEQAEVPRLREVTNQDFSFAPGVEVTEIDQVKGLEFDYVILAETSAKVFPESPASRRVLHVGATRAVHQLWLTCVDDLSPIVREAMGG